MKLNVKRHSGFTLAELLIAVWVTSIILAAVAALSFALGSANDSADDTAEIQSRIRYSTLRVSELIRNCKLICGNRGDRIAIWRSDDDPQDGHINPRELVYIESGNDNDCLRILDFSCADGLAGVRISIDSIQDGSAYAWLGASVALHYINLIDDCSSVVFTTDVATPRTGRVNLFFGINQHGSIDIYQISASLRCWAGCLLNENDDIVDYDDDM